MFWQPEWTFGENRPVNTVADFNLYFILNK